MNLEEALVKLNNRYKQIRNEYNIECINCDFSDNKHPNKEKYFGRRLFDYINSTIAPNLDKQDLTQIMYYSYNNIPLEQTNEYKYLNKREIMLIEYLVTAISFHEITI